MVHFKSRRCWGCGCHFQQETTTTRAYCSDTCRDTTVLADKKQRRRRAPEGLLVRSVATRHPDPNQATIAYRALVLRCIRRRTFGDVDEAGAILEAAGKTWDNLTRDYDKAVGVTSTP